MYTTNLCSHLSEQVSNNTGKTFSLVTFARSPFLSKHSTSHAMSDLFDSSQALSRPSNTYGIQVEKKKQPQIWAEIKHKIWE